MQNNSSENFTSNRADELEVAKKPYSTPELRLHGALEKITLADSQTPGGDTGDDF